MGHKNKNINIFNPSLTMCNTFSFNGCLIQDFGDYITIQTFNDTYKYSTTKGKYCFTFPGLFLNKYRILFFDKQDDDDILCCMSMAAVLEN